MLSKISHAGRSSSGLAIAILSIAMIACRTQPMNHEPRNERGHQAGREGDGSGSDSTPTDGYVHPQGTEIQALPPGLEGFYVDATTGWSHRGAALSRVAVVDGDLAVAEPHPKAVSDLVGATFTATLVDGSAMPMRIVRAIRHDNPDDEPPPVPRQRDYVIEYSSGGRWAPLCPPEAPGAIPIAGSFGHTPQGHVNGDYHPTPTRVTFACRAGVAAKCQGWGYRSWNPKRAPYFQACTRMARADYCGNGHSRTVDGTLINYLDLHGESVPQLRPAPGFVPEAVWGTGGPGAPTAAICLSRTRWSTIPIGPRSPCADLVPDPRDEAPTDGRPRRFCDDMTVQDWADAGARFVNMSRPLDVGIFVWTDGEGHFATTTRYPWLGKDVQSPGPPGYPVFVSIEGAAYKPEVPAPRRKGLMPLFRYTQRTRTIALEALTTGAPPAGFGHPVLEAYVFEFKPASEPPTSTARPLYLYSDGHDHYVTLSDERAPASSSYSKVQQIGWLPH